MVENNPIFEVESKKRLENIGKVILVGSGKGGVGKSFVASGLALMLSRRYKTGILDLDIHGASLPNYLSVKPPIKSGKDGLQPAKAGKVGVMSVALFTGDNSVPLRGYKKQALIPQLFSLTNWGMLDYLVVDLPPSTGEELLSAFALFGEKCSLLLVTTPSRHAISIVSRLRQLAKSERVPVAGIVANMAYVNEGGKKIETFGKLDPKHLTRKLEAPVLAEIPLEYSVNSTSLETLLFGRWNPISKAFSDLAEKVLVIL